MKQMNSVQKHTWIVCSELHFGPWHFKAAQSLFTWITTVRIKHIIMSKTYRCQNRETGLNRQVTSFCDQLRRRNYAKYRPYYSQKYTHTKKWESSHFPSEVLTRHLTVLQAIPQIAILFPNAYVQSHLLTLSQVSTHFVIIILVRPEARKLAIYPIPSKFNQVQTFSPKFPLVLQWC